MMQISQGTIGSPWHQTYHSSSSTSDLSSFDHGYLRQSPEEYRSRSSMESLDHSSPAYHPYHYLSPAKSTNCIDQLAHLHSKRDSAYSSFSTNSSIPEYQTNPFSKERSYSMESMHSQNNLQEGIKHADIRYIKTVYDAQRGVSEEYEVNSSSFKNRSYSRPSSNTRNSSGPTSRLEQNRVCSESDSLGRGPPLPPMRSDSYAVTRHHERPSSWSSMDQNRSFKTHTKATGSHPSSGTCNSTQHVKPPFSEAQLHTVLEKSPESSPRTKSKQTYVQAPKPGQPMLPTGIYPVPSPEPHFAHAPPLPKSNNGRLYPALVKEGACSPRPACGLKVASSLHYDNDESQSDNLHNTSTAIYLTDSPSKEQDKKQEGTSGFAHYKLHFSAGPEIPIGSSKAIDNNLNVSPKNQYVHHSDQKIINGTRKTAKNKTYIKKQSKSEEQELPVTAENRISSEVPLQNEWNELNTLQEISPSKMTAGPCRNEHNIDILKDKESGSPYITSPLNHRPDDRPHRKDHRNKLDSLSFTKLIEDTDSSAVLHNDPLKFEEPTSPSQMKNCDFTKRRLSSSSTQSGHSVQYGKADVDKSRSLVLEKISKIEQREQKSHRNVVPTGTLYGQQAGQPTRGPNNRGSVNSIDELKNRFSSREHKQCSERQRLSSFQDTEKPSVVQQLKRAGSVYSMKSTDTHKQTADSHVDKMQQHKYEQSLVQAAPDDSKRKVDAQTMPNKDDHWHASTQDTLGFNRAYRNSIKDAQSKVLEATSYRRKDLEISPPQYQKPDKNIKRPTSALLQGKISPVSLHAPKERHSITPVHTRSKFEDVQIQENQGSPLAVARIGARRRLTAEQRKRCYSEPEKMHEVGTSENEKSPLSVLKREQNGSFLENTVADRRKMFESDGIAGSTVNLSKPELKQIQQNALADYMARKIGRRPSSQEIGFLKQRSQSTYFSESMMESHSNSSTSSMTSLHEHSSYSGRDINIGRVSSTLPPGLTGLFDLANLEQDVGRQESRGRSSSFANQRVLDYRTKSEFTMCKQKSNYTESKPIEFEEQAVKRKPGKSASAEDLLDTSQQTTVNHARSQSTPASDKILLDVLNRQEVNVKSTSHGGVGQCISILKNKDGGPIEKRSFCSTLQSHPEQSAGVAGGTQPLPRNILANQSTVQPDIHHRHTRTQSLTPSYGMHSKTFESRPMTLPGLNQASPSKRNQVSNNHAAQDFITAEEYLYAGKNAKICTPPLVVDESTIGPMARDHNTLEDLADKVRSKKSTPPERPPPPKIKWTSSNDVILSQKTTSCPSFENKLSPGLNNNRMWSTSSSETDTPMHHGKISLRISESGLHSSAPVISQDDDDDEVFVKEPENVAFPKEPVVIILPSSPSSILQNASITEKNDKCLLAPSLPLSSHENETSMTTQPKGEVNKRHPFIDNKKTTAPRNMESSNTSKISSNVSTKTVLPLIKPSRSVEVPQPITSTGETTHNFEEGMPSPPEDMPLFASQFMENEVPASESIDTSTSFKTAIMSPEDIKSQELAKEIVDKDKSLADILDPESKMKTTMDLMSGLFTKSSTALNDKNRKWKGERKIPDNTFLTENAKKEDKAENAHNDSEYSSILTSKVELQKIKDIKAVRSKEEENIDVNEKKAELIANINHKLEILKDAKDSLLLDIKINNSLGDEVETLIESLCKPNEYDKYKMFIGDLDKVVNLLLSLSGRLARVENVLSSLNEDTDAEERKTWIEKKKQLSGQHEDARELKENLDRRERLVMDILGNYLTGEQFQEYQHFVKMKSALLIKQRELDDKMKLGQEQLKCLSESLPSDFQIEGQMPSREENISSLGNVNIPPPLTSSL
uniref:Shroom family member 3 n=1 Tax=Leptobrachium leishanense TaxID=445787 RepID=A0A8C5P876_9ANUR